MKAYASFIPVASLHLSRARAAESIVPDLQSLSVGDEVPMHPKAPGIPVAALGVDLRVRPLTLPPTEIEPAL